MRVNSNNHKETQGQYSDRKAEQGFRFNEKKIPDKTKGYTRKAKHKKAWD